MRKPFSFLLLLPFLHGCSGSGAKLLWQAPIASETPPIVRNETVYVKGFHAGRHGEAIRLFTLDTQTGNVRWSAADAVKEV